MVTYQGNYALRKKKKHLNFQRLLSLNLNGGKPVGLQILLQVTIPPVCGIMEVK